MKAGWFFCFSDYNPSTMVLQPLWPDGFSPTSLEYVLYDIRRLEELAVPNDHVHQVMGTIAFVNDEVGDGHYHYVQYFGSNWQQVTIGASEHDHPFTVGGVSNVRFIPDYFVMFLSADDAEFDLLATDSQWYLIGETEVTLSEGVYSFGEIDNTAFSGQEITQWQNRFRIALGRDMPAEITNPRRLVSWFCPMAAPNMYDWWNESMFRPTTRLA